MDQDLTKILVIDDEVHICELLDEFLTLIGYEVATTSKGETALAVFKQEEPDLVFLDIRMPGFSGIDILKDLKATQRCFGVIMLSAFGDDQTITEALEAGADYYVQKPMDFENLKETLTSLKQKVFARRLQ